MSTKARPTGKNRWLAARLAFGMLLLLQLLVVVVAAMASLQARVPLLRRRVREV